MVGARCHIRIDIWALACTCFELDKGQPTFDNIMPEKTRLIQEWMAIFGDLLAEWRQHLEVRTTPDVDPMMSNSHYGSCTDLQPRASITQSFLYSNCLLLPLCLRQCSTSYLGSRTTVRRTCWLVWVASTTLYGHLSFLLLLSHAPVALNNFVTF